MMSLFLPALPESDDPEELELRAQLASSDTEMRARAALRLGSAHLTTEPDAARRLLRQALHGSPLTCARAHLRLSYLAQRDDDAPVAREHVDAARVALTQGELTTDSTERLRILVDVGVAFAFVGQYDAAIALLQSVDTDLRNLRSDAPGDVAGTEALRALLALTNLRLGQVQAKTNPASADAALRLAAAIGTSSVAATAALERGWLLEHRLGGFGPEIEEQYRRAADLNDPVASPRASMCLGDLLWRNGNAEGAGEEWRRAAATGDENILARVTRRLNHIWPYETERDAEPPMPLDPATPVQGVEPPTELGRIASGRAPDHSGKRRRVIVVGAGTGGHYLLPGLRHDYEVVGFVDDNLTIKPVDGLPLLGAISDLERLLSSGESDVHQVLFAIPTASGETRLRVAQAALRCGVEVRSLPSMFELRRGHPMVPQLRPFEIWETYGDFPWKIDRPAAGVVRGRRVAIVGAGSSLGQELARRVAHGQARHLLLLDEPPGPLLKVATDLREHRDFLDCDARIVDYADAMALDELLREFSPEIVFHCGGVHHAPEDVLPAVHAVRANVHAARMVALSAKWHGASDFVLASADRAAHRACPFDMTKALAEQAVLQLAAEPRTIAHSEIGLHILPEPAKGLRVSVLRLPNVWGRDNAIVGRLKDQLADGGPIRVSPTAKRCLVTSWQAAEAMLRLLSGDHLSGVFALTSGQVVSIRELAERLIWINGLTSGRDIDIIDDPEVDGKAGLHLWGECEAAGVDVAPDVVQVTQARALLDDFNCRLTDLQEALATGSRDSLIAALRVDDDLDRKALTA